MLENFIARSLWYNEFIEAETTTHGMPILRQPGNATVDQLRVELVAQVAA